MAKCSSVVKISRIGAKGNAFRINSVGDALAQDLHNQYDSEDGEILKEKSIEVQVLGRIMTRRAMGKKQRLSLFKI